MKKLLLLPLCLAAMASYSQKSESTPPPPPPAPPPPKIEIVRFEAPQILKNEESQDFYKRNPTVATAGYYNQHTITLKLKNKKRETYNLNNEAERKAFTDKYGEPPTAPPPPPPPPAPPKSVKSST